MKVGDLVHCIWQPKGAGVDKKTECVMPMQYTIKGEFGLIVHMKEHQCDIMFPQLDGYIHSLAHSAFEVVSESR